ncbi:MAG: hypothetical protein PH343_10370 [Nitrospira sp.]|nr:hypothetical protein [Nitrospira sp.]
MGWQVSARDRICGIYAWNYTSVQAVAQKWRYSRMKRESDARNVARWYFARKCHHVLSGALRRDSAWGKKDGDS